MLQGIRLPNLSEFVGTLTPRLPRYLFFLVIFHRFSLALCSLGNCKWPQVASGPHEAIPVGAGLRHHNLKHSVQNNKIIYQNENNAASLKLAQYFVVIKILILIALLHFDHYSSLRLDFRPHLCERGCNIMKLSDVVSLPPM